MINTCRESLSNLKPAENHDQTVPQKKADMEELEQLERTIVSGLETFKAVGLSLAEIHNRRLYKLRGFSDFGEYCEVQFKMSRSHGYRQLSHIVTCQSIGEDPLCIPEKVTRPLSRIKDPQTAQMLWQEAKAERGGQIPTSGEMKYKILCHENNIQSQSVKSHAQTPFAIVTEDEISADQTDESTQRQFQSSQQIYCTELSRNFSLQNLAEELLAEIETLQPQDNTASPYDKLLNQLNKLMNASVELKNKLNTKQRHLIRREYKRKAGKFFDTIMRYFN